MGVHASSCLLKKLVGIYCWKLVLSIFKFVIITVLIWCCWFWWDRFWKAGWRAGSSHLSEASLCFFSMMSLPSTYVFLVYLVLYEWFYIVFLVCLAVFSHQTCSTAWKAWNFTLSIARTRFFIMWIYFRVLNQTVFVAFLWCDSLTAASYSVLLFMLPWSLIGSFFFYSLSS